MGWWTKVVDFWTNTEEVKVRSKDKKGRYIADDKSTPDVNEAYTKVRKKRGRPAKITTNNIGD
jgi:hypothetical protein|tara:strand:- start:152 stop:340 length:189 start_codon:yes stop_codon:yes gene_type:complete